MILSFLTIDSDIRGVSSITSIFVVNAGAAVLLYSPQNDIRTTIYVSTRIGLDTRTESGAAGHALTGPKKISFNGSHDHI